ncbi:hypothetical protein PMT9312_1174 [Prochlorococcus marinus str. MIT 9312]|uniref:Uncharacterized protein n=1 Tax=Prochlorococcus marinus (strain MIT 9312) TaxID=74546 RepID=Q31A62_PROM9|nr:hypothetical protein PMT9312_1174 [Prochlorococcus marinus str. MIT 9312]
MIGTTGFEPATYCSQKTRSKLEGIRPIFFMTKWNEKSWQKDSLSMKSYSPSDAKLLMGGVKGLKDAWRLAFLHV